MTNYLPLFLLIIPLFYSCSNADVGEKKSGAETLYCDYQIWVEEDRDEATLRLQYKETDEGPGLLVQPPGRVLLDTIPLPADSSKFTGTYYELTVPVAALSGKHTIVFIDPTGKIHRDDFRFEPLSLAKELPETLQKKPFSIRLNGVSSGAASVRLVMTDTSMQSPDVNEEFLLNAGKITVDSTLLQNLTKGPVTLEIYREEEQPVSRGGGGKLSITSVLRREIEFQ